MELVFLNETSTTNLEEKGLLILKTSKTQSSPKEVPGKNKVKQLKVQNLIKIRSMTVKYEGHSFL